MAKCNQLTPLPCKGLTRAYAATGGFGVDLLFAEPGGRSAVVSFHALPFIRHRDLGITSNQSVGKLIVVRVGSEERRR